MEPTCVEAILIKAESLYSIQATLCTVYTYRLHCTLYRVLAAVCTLQCKLTGFSAHCTLNVLKYRVPRALGTVQGALKCVQV